MVADLFAKKLHLAFSKKGSSLLAGTPEMKIIKPQTFMNDSGQAVSQALNYFKIPADHLVVIHDDMDIPFGQGKIQRGRSSAGHNGVESIIGVLGTDDFWRMRIGIAGDSREQIPGERYVLSRFSESELAELSAHIIPKATMAIAHLIDHGPQAAANAYNRKTADIPRPA
jgi:PTH1 family peptidyl-tRNA hydrolase